MLLLDISILANVVDKHCFLKSILWASLNQTKALLDFLICKKSEKAWLIFGSAACSCSYKTYSIPSALFSQYPIFTSKPKSVREFDWTQMAGNSSEMTVAKLNHRTWSISMQQTYRGPWERHSLILSPSITYCHRLQFDNTGRLYDFCKTSNQFAAITVYF